MAANDASLYTLRYNQISMKLEGAGGTPEWNPLNLTNSGGGGGTPGGSNTQVQYNSSGSFAGSANFTFASNTLTLTNSANAISLAGSTTGNPVTLTSTGSDTSVPIQFLAKGHNGAVLIGPATNLAAIEAFHGVETPLDLVIQPRETDVYTGITVTSANNTDNFYGYIEFLRSRGTTASPTDVQAGDIIGEMASIGYASGYTVFALLDGVANDINNGGFQMTFRAAGVVPGSAQLYFSAAGIGIGSSASQPLDINLTLASSTVSGRVANQANNGAASWLARNDAGHTGEWGIGGSARGDGFQDTVYTYTTQPTRMVSAGWKWNKTAGIDDGNTVMQLNATGSLSLGTVSPSASAIIEADSTTQGIRFPNMTTTQKNAISSPAAGLVVFDSTLSKLCVYSGTAWQTITSV